MENPLNTILAMIAILIFAILSTAEVMLGTCSIYLHFTPMTNVVSLLAASFSFIAGVLLWVLGTSNSTVPEEDQHLLATWNGQGAIPPCPRFIKNPVCIPTTILGASGMGLGLLFLGFCAT